MIVCCRPVCFEDLQRFVEVLVLECANNEMVNAGGTVSDNIRSPMGTCLHFASSSGRNTLTGNFGF